MKRFHVSVGVADVERSVEFYRQLFGVEPNVRKNDYAKWLLDDPRINFSVNLSATQRGVDHVGLQADSVEEFQSLQGRVRSAGAETVEQPDVECCYAHSSKTWVRDPDGLNWETFITHGPGKSFESVEPRSCPDACCG